MNEQSPLERHLQRTARDEGPDYYRTQPVQPWDVVDTWPIEQRVGFYRGNVLKYVMRAGTKPDAEELREAEKAAHYAAKLVEVLRGG